MLSQFERIIKLACLALAALLLFYVSRIAIHPDPLSSVTVPSVPTLALAKSTATNAAPASRPGGTNSLGKGATNRLAATNGIATPAPRPINPANVNKDLSKIIQTRIDLITQSEILGPVIRPLPMALLGIAGQTIFFRAPDGQTGMLKEGEELGGVKLLRIGVNRILVEQEGEKKELSIYQGYGGEPLL